MKRTTFVDAQNMARLHPSTFRVPDSCDLLDLKVGDYIKASTGNERFWIEVIGVEESAAIGRVDKDLLNTYDHGLSCDDIVVVPFECVFQIVAEMWPKTWRLID